jgi:hypothetical protein
MLRDLVDSIKSIEAYDRFKEKKLIRVLLYLLVISLAAGFIITTSLQNRYKEIVFLLPEYYDSKFPNFRLEEGILTTDNNEKVVIEKDKVAIIFDTSSSADENSLSTYKKGALLLKDRFYIKTSKYGRIEKKWTDLGIGNLDKEKARDYLGVIPSLIVSFTIFFILGLLFINIVSTLFIALVFTLLKRFWKKKLSYIEVFKMTVHSLTLPMVLITAGNILLGDGLTVDKYLYAYYIAGVYLIVAIGRTGLPKKVKTTENKQQTSKNVKRGKKK